MRLSHRRPAFVAFLAAGFCCAPPVQAGEPRIAPALHFQFTPQPGTAWYLDGTTDGQTWTQQAGPFFATGAAVNHYQRPGAEKEFRLRFVDPATIGHAPAVLAGTSFFLAKSASQPVEVVFMNASSGVLRLDDQQARIFTYTWLKNSANGGEAILTAPDGRLTLLRLNFTDGNLGSWGMEDIPSREAASLITQTVDAGAFSFHEGRFRRGVANARLPGDLSGRTMILEEGGRFTHVTFADGANATVTTPKGQTLTTTYSYDPESNSRGSLHFYLSGSTPLSLQLDLAGPGLGSFSDIPNDANLPPSRNGTVTLPDEQSPPNPNCPPESIVGLTYVFTDPATSSTWTLEFLADGSGYVRQNVGGALQITGFTYSYDRTGGGSAKVSLTFPGGTRDAVDEYELTFKNDCTGEFKQESFTDGKASAGNSGTFNPEGMAGLFQLPMPGLGL